MITPVATRILAVDFDEVCVAFLSAFCIFNNDTRGTSVTVAECNSYLFHENPKFKIGTMQEGTDLVHQFFETEGFKSGIDLIPGAVEGLLELKKRGFELHMVTSRQLCIENETLKCIARNFPEGTFSSVHFGNHFGKSGQKRGKPEMCREIGACGLIDDSKDYAKHCAAIGIDVFLFGNYGWNSGEIVVDSNTENQSVFNPSTEKDSVGSDAKTLQAKYDKHIMRVKDWAELLKHPKLQ